jgi:hypothetical protein
VLASAQPRRSNDSFISISYERNTSAGALPAASASER